MKLNELKQDARYLKILEQELLGLESNSSKKPFGSRRLPQDFFQVIIILTHNLT